ncbi:MAG: type II toxin-antitoxin system VapC family toxin [Bryobacterales bacterium]|nr:type II toxin-antitoxin system VapC family toxin [Bryobacteraceae bacterium]MDW8355105.1 type II toxin-antitoxin system VapC family toxin [Bryobacterales bacterium]
MRIVLDASAAIEAGFRRGGGSRFVPLLEDAEEVLSPDIFVAEVVNTVWKFHRFGNLELDLCEEGMERTLGLPDQLMSSRELYREAFHLARLLQHSVYDMLYLALARREDALLLSADQTLRREAKRQGIRTA